MLSCSAPPVELDNAIGPPHSSYFTSSKDKMRRKTKFDDENKSVEGILITPKRATYRYH